MLTASVNQNTKNTLILQCTIVVYYWHCHSYCDYYCYHYHYRYHSHYRYYNHIFLNVIHQPRRQITDIKMKCPAYITHNVNDNIQIICMARRD